jgi:hypothetical protein
VLCCKCKSLNAVDGQRWCRQCRADYMRIWRPKNADSLRRLAFAQGVSALRTALVRSFSAVGDASLTGQAASRIVAATEINVPRGTNGELKKAGQFALCDSPRG